MVRRDFALDDLDPLREGGGPPNLDADTRFLGAEGDVLSGHDRVQVPVDYKCIRPYINPRGFFFVHHIAFDHLIMASVYIHGHF